MDLNSKNELQICMGQIHLYNNNKNLSYKSRISYF